MGRIMYQVVHFWYDGPSWIDMGKLPQEFLNYNFPESQGHPDMQLVKI